MVCFIFPLEYIFTAPLPRQSQRIVSNTSRGMAHAAVTSGKSSYVFPKKIKVKRIEKFGRPLDRKAAMHTVPQCHSESCRIARAPRSNVPNVREFNLKLTHHFHIASLHRLKGGKYDTTSGNYFMQCVKCIVDSHMSILCTGTRQKVSVLEEFLSNASRPGGAFLD